MFPRERKTPGLTKVTFKARTVLLFILIPILVLFSCKSTPKEEAVIDTAEEGNNEVKQLSGGLADEIRGLIETGRLSSMTQALELIRSRDLGGVEFGRVMNGIITVLMKQVYPDSRIRLPALDLPQTHNYTRIIREAERGNYIKPPANSTDFFEYILPFLSVTNETPAQTITNITNDLVKAGVMRPQSVLPPYLLGLVCEHSSQYDEAAAYFQQAYDISNECYPALIGIARVLRLSGRNEEAAAISSDLVIRYPDSLEIKKQLAITLYDNRDWSRAGPAVDEILQNDPRDGDFILMKAHILIEQGLFNQAQPPLETYSSIDPNNRLYLFLRARVQFEGNRNRDSALNYLRSIIRNNNEDEEVLIYAARLLMESQRAADQAEGREYLELLQKTSGASVTVLGLSLRDAVSRENWQEAQGFLNRILSVRRGVQDLIDAYTVERGLGNNTRALTYARELYDRDTSNNDYAAVYISALIDNGRRDEASRMLERGLNAPIGAAVKSRFFFLRSRIQANEEAALGDLRSSLFEDPRNLEALIAMFEIYHRRREERRAVYYQRQALAIAPENPRIKRYEKEYASLLGRQ